MIKIQGHASTLLEHVEFRAEPDEPLYADDRNFYEVATPTRSKSGQKTTSAIERLLWAGNSLDRAQAIFNAEIGRHPTANALLRRWPQT